MSEKYHALNNVGYYLAKETFCLFIVLYCKIFFCKIGYGILYSYYRWRNQEVERWSRLFSMKAIGIVWNIILLNVLSSFSTSRQYRQLVWQGLCNATISTSAAPEVLLSMYLFVLKLINCLSIPHTLYQLWCPLGLCGNHYLPRTNILSLHTPLIFQKPISWCSNSIKFMKAIGFFLKFYQNLKMGIQFSESLSIRILFRKVNRRLAW